MLIINNDDVAKVLTMETTLAALEESYLGLVAGTAVCRPRIDIRIPTSDPAKNYQWGTMEGGSTAGYFAIRMKSDIIYETQYNGVTTQEKYCMRPGLYCGLILLTSAVLLIVILIRSHFGERTVEEPLRYALAVNPPVRVPPSLNGFALWNAIVLVLMIVAYGYPTGQFFFLKKHTVPAVEVTAQFSPMGGR